MVWGAIKPPILLLRAPQSRGSVCQTLISCSSVMKNAWLRWLKAEPLLSGCVEIRHTDVGDFKRRQTVRCALRNGKQSSMRLAIDAVKDGEASCAVSAGNTGALMAMAMFGLRTLPGIDRPAISSFFPTMRGESCMLDLGANVECSADNLVQFAVMGEVFARTVLGLGEADDRPPQHRGGRSER